ncbi:MAG: DNA primase [Rubellimicrobium sp.]|nr:DNA primase [Rubellimicrobium sp.]
MSLPPGFLDELRGRLSLGQVVGRKVVWDGRKSNQGKGDLWAPCPFHQEKSASFHVDDRKGYYYCFGCHAKGDAISFVRETENVGFMEAVEILAREAGMTMPARDPEAARRAEARIGLAEVMEQAVQYYRLQLRTVAGQGARAYLARRGLSEAALERWGIGFAPDDRQGVIRHLTGKGIAPELIVAAGLAARPEGGGAPYDRFRDRIIFPIRDARGRAISLGGRAMAQNARAKYLNGPETELFDKGRALFNHGPAREAAGKEDRLIVAEGYMDVIALSEAGFGATVAPLGTAITEDQLRMMWRIADEPVIALDGDKAGIGAALRLVDLALPLVEAGKGLRFAILPEGKDPDDLIRAEGPGAMQAVLDRAEPMVRLLWRRETEARDFDSPERKAALDKSLRAAIARIRDPSIRAHYGEEIRALRWELFGASRRSPPGGRAPGGRETRGRFTQGAAVQAATRRSMLSTAAAGSEDHLHVGVILVLLCRYPALLPEFIDAFEAMPCDDPDHALLQGALLKGDGAGALSPDALPPEAAAHLEKLLAAPHIALIPAIRRPGEVDLARMTVAEELARLAARRSHRVEIEELTSDIESLTGEWVTSRLSQAAAAVDTTRRPEHEDLRDVVIAPNGMALDKADLERSQDVFGQIRFVKGRERG